MADADVPPARKSDGEMPSDDQGQWPDWRISHATAGDLARYVNPAHATNWVPADLLSPLRGQAGRRVRRDRAEQLYKSLSARHVPYASAPWNPAAYDLAGRPAYQRIRTPSETIQGPATCLDLVLTFAAMAAEADLRPVLAIRYRPAPHALLVLDLSGGMSETSTDGGWPEPPGFTSRRDEPGVWDQDEDVSTPLIGLAQTEDWLPIDVVGATRDFSLDFGQTSGMGVAEQEDPPGSSWVLVDVRQVLVHLAARRVAPYQPPRGSSSRRIHGYLPSLPGFRDFPTRTGALRRLQSLIAAGQPGTVVIQAPSGYGKSMLAHQLAISADRGCGWFLNATNAKELRRSLAQAERSEHELGGEPPRSGGEKADAVDDYAFAAAALDRLRTAEQPWVVVVDNCDSPPDAAQLVNLVPKPHARGQIVIVTTTHPGWLNYTTDALHRVPLAGLSAGDLRDLRLPPDLSRAVDGRPLVALALAALRDRGGVTLPAATEQDGPALAWDLLRQSARADQPTVGLARLLAWLPPEPTPEKALAKVTAMDTAPGDTLSDLGFVTWSAEAGPGRLADPGDSPGAGLLMHRLFAAAVRDETWRDDPGAAAEAISGALTTDQGRWLFISAADDSALARLEDDGEHPEPGDARRAFRHLTDEPRSGPAPGLIWYGLGHVRERRGPVVKSKEPFKAADVALDPDDYPYQVAESRIGLARIVFQDPRSTVEDLEAAQSWLHTARNLLASNRNPDYRQLREQSNALYWLIARRLAAQQPDLAGQATGLTEIRENLWLSFAERLRIARDQGDDQPVSEDAIPELDDGLGPERAFYNLAGVDINLAKMHHELALRAAAESGRALTADDERLEPAAQSLRDAEHVYDVVRELREKRYGGRPHPHLAACLHGLAIVEYYRATLLGLVGALADAAGYAAAALDQRLRIAGSLTGLGTPAALSDPDVRKSDDLLLKITAASVLARFTDVAGGSAAVTKVLQEAIREWMLGPGRTPTEPAPARLAVLGFEHETHVNLPRGTQETLDLTAVPDLIHAALRRISPLAGVASGIEVTQVRPTDPETRTGSLDVGLALPAPVGPQLEKALGWLITSALQTPGHSPAPEAESAGSPVVTAPAEPAPAPRAAPPIVRDRPPHPDPVGFLEAPQRKAKPRYLSASYPDSIPPGRRFSLEAAVTLTRGAGRSEQLMRGFEVGPRGKQVLLTITAPGLTVHGDHQQSIFVPADADSEPVRFDLEGTAPGVRRVRLRAWDGGSCVGELWAEVTVSEHGPSGPGRTSAIEMEAEATPGEITLEVTHELVNGQNRYCFQLQDPLTAPARVYLPLREDPAQDVEALIHGLDTLAEDPRYTPDQIYRALWKQGIQLWQKLVPAAVHEQFWACQSRIGQLTILADNDAFPWELLYPKDQANDAGFLVAQHFPVTRRVHGLARRRLLRRKPARFVLPGNAPERAEDEVRVLRQLLQAPEPSISTLQELQELIDDGAFGVLHFACHAGFDRNDRGPRIHLDLPFLPRELVDAGRTWQAPLIFLNACRSAGPRYQCIGIDSFAEMFLQANAGAFIGSLWEIRDDTAQGFATQLYTSLLGGQELGAAVTELRRNASEGDPTWLAYAVYGHPQAKMI